MKRKGGGILNILSGNRMTYEDERNFRAFFLDALNNFEPSKIEHRCIDEIYSTNKN